MLSNQDQDWIPLVTYRNSLLQGADDDNIKVPAPPKGRRGRKKKMGAPEPEESGPPTPQRPMTPQQQQPPPQQHRPMTPQQPQHVAPLPQQQQQPMQMQQPMTPQQAMTPQQIQQPMTPQQAQQPMTPQPPAPHHGRMTPQQTHHAMAPQQQQQQHPALTPQQHHIQMNPQEAIGQPQLTSTVMQATRDGIRQIHEDHSMSYHDPQQSLLNAHLALAQQQAAMATTHYSPADYQPQQQQQQQHQVPMGYNITSPQAASPMPANAQYMHASMPNPIVQYDHTNPFQNVTASIQQTPQPSPYYGN